MCSWMLYDTLALCEQPHRKLSNIGECRILCPRGAQNGATAVFWAHVDAKMGQRKVTEEYIPARELLDDVG